ncbi:MAG: hypothetical protein H7293_06100 [Candidatus Saccharibacteria bacterium]|nr:hypothetical protein [Rhodoferax sp.]
MQSIGHETLTKTAVSSTITILFEDGKAELAASESEILAGWVKEWMHHTSKYRVHIGGAHDTPRIGRLQRFIGIKALLSSFGVNRYRIFPDSDWIKPSRLGTVEELPPDLVWLQLERRDKE